ncbi:hypothetical protein JXA88_08765 [Candidatus Fermentibacteria bacterium]|nr:hypothetical protein [Candidatus Fermentibacteria bacterium]
MRALLCIILLTGTAFAQQAADLLPEDNQIPGWVKDGEPQTAQTPEELYGLINGAATPYLENGFVECVFQNYTGLVAGEPTFLEAQVFDQGTQENAHAVFVLTATGLETAWDGAGDEARINYMLPFNFTLEFYRNRFFVRLNIGREADSLQALQVIQSFAYAMDEVAVPVELHSFNAVRQGTRCVVSWVTASETDCFGFAVRRSGVCDPSTAAVISSELIRGEGTSAVPRHYRFVDASPPAGPAFYWLEEYSLSGTTRLYGPAPMLDPGQTSSWGRIKASFSF